MQPDSSDDSNDDDGGDTNSWHGQKKEDSSENCRSVFAVININ
jgi:hypothetical protein